MANNAKPNNTFLMAKEFNKEQTITDFISTFDIQTFLSENRQLSPETFLLQCKDNTKEQNWYLAEQLKLYPKAIYKLPTFTKASCWLSSKSYEQCSSEASAKLKSSLFSGEKLLDLSGGLGVDDVFFSETFKEVTSLDPDENLNILVRVNFQKLQKNNIHRLDIKAESFLKSTIEHYSLIYLDADRRVSNHKSKLLETGSPDYFSLEQEIFGKTNCVLLKLSPLIDLDYCIEKLNHLKQIIIVSVQNEVKEVLCLLDNTHLNEITISNYFIDKSGEIISELQAPNNKRKLQAGNLSTEFGDYFFEASAGLIKSGLDKLFAFENKLEPISQTGFYFTGNTAEIAHLGFGRIFKILSKQVYSKTGFRTYLKNETIKQANFSARDFGMSTEELKQTFSIKDGGEDYFFFGKSKNQTKWVFHTQKINSEN
jgi:hypothetical protein